LQLLKREPPGSFISLVGEIIRDEELLTMFRKQVMQPLITRMEEEYKKSIDSGEIKSFDTALIVRTIASLMFGTAIIRALEGEESPLNKMPPKEIASQMLQLLLDGISTHKQKGELHDTE